MGLSFLERVGVVVTESAAESRRFGNKTVRVTVGREALTDPIRAVDDVRRVLEQLNDTLVIIRYPTEFVDLIRLLGNGPYSLYPSGSLIYWGMRSNESFADPPTRTDVEVVDRKQGATLEEASTVIADSFDRYTNHYAYNPRLDPNAVQKGYMEWAMQTLSDAKSPLFILRLAGQPAGVAVISAEPGTWEVELAGMTRASQGRGLYPYLLRRVITDSQASRSRVVISTQSHNVRVQRLWACLGMAPVDSYDTLHVMS